MASERKTGVSVKDVDQHEFTKALGAFLKRSGKMKIPEWVDIVKLGRFNELAPYSQDWFYTRAASVCRHLYIKSPVGVGAFTKIYGVRGAVSFEHLQVLVCLQPLSGLEKEKMMKRTRL